MRSSCCWASSPGCKELPVRAFSVRKDDPDGGTAHMPVYAAGVLRRYYSEHEDRVRGMGFLLVAEAA
jgi:hypothetical protein